jgi:hypothetical protein
LDVINSYHIDNKLIIHTEKKSAFTLGKGRKRVMETTMMMKVMLMMVMTMMMMTTAATTNYVLSELCRF